MLIIMETIVKKYSTKLIRFYFKNIINSRYNSIFRNYPKSFQFSESLKKSNTNDKTEISVFKNNSSVKSQSQIKANEIISPEKEGLIKREINQRIFDKIFHQEEQGERDMPTDTNSLLDLSRNQNDSSLTNFSSTLDRKIDLSQNKEVSQLILENKIDFSNSNLVVKSLNLTDKFLNEESKEELLEIDLGKIKSFPQMNINYEEIKNNSNYEYDISLVGKKVSHDEEGLNLNNYMVINEQDKHYISPVIFHDESDTKKSKIEYQDSISDTILKNPWLIISFIVLCYYIYPSLWKKDYFMALSDDYNNREILKVSSDSQTFYDYINYRRGLYVSVRSNFS